MISGLMMNMTIMTLIARMYIGYDSS